MEQSGSKSYLEGISQAKKTAALCFVLWLLRAQNLAKSPRKSGLSDLKPKAKHGLIASDRFKFGG